MHINTMPERGETMSKEEAIEGLNRVAVQKARLAHQMQKAISKFLRAEERDPKARELEGKEKALATLWLLIEMQETVKTSMLKSGIEPDALENATRLFRKEAKH